MQPVAPITENSGQMQNELFIFQFSEPNKKNNFHINFKHHINCHLLINSVIFILFILDSQQEVYRIKACSQWIGSEGAYFYLEA